MFFTDREQMRRFYLDAWRKYQAGQVLQPLEAMVGEVVAQHPEYHKLLEQPDKALQRDYLPEDGETNPFLHMGMHIALREQVSTDRPAGIRRIHHNLSQALGDPLEAEHLMMEPLAEGLWQAQREGREPDEAGYLRALEQLERRLARRRR
ncbi:uncharacterized protein DUF1841 [Alkalispirillum mobile]|uniref:Uncharacterized protein DUF1841 n=1 Tax=Alkalispirillum mobile TaxID=85925 RepID=A0A498BXR7_9GAMM|nr:DUF1841 family protein [Alkalispirillum mobile]RLK48594.1 uncharacterized protein DUF1841 [Alkalispirillum mobile]